MCSTTHGQTLVEYRAIGLELLSPGTPQRKPNLLIAARQVFDLRNLTSIKAVGKSEVDWLSVKVARTNSADENIAPAWPEGY